MAKKKQNKEEAPVVVQGKAAVNKGEQVPTYRKDAFGNKIRTGYTSETNEQVKENEGGKAEAPESTTAESPNAEGEKGESNDVPKETDNGGVDAGSPTEEFHKTGDLKDAS